jgi:hypothetical protein
MYVSICDYCGNQEKIDSQPVCCLRCGDANIRIKQIETADRDVFGYRFSPAFPDLSFPDLSKTVLEEVKSEEAKELKEKEDPFWNLFFPS